MHAKRKKVYKKNETGSNLFKELWNAAVALRGSIEPADYKRYVLPLIFLRFLSLRYEQRVSEIDAEIADPQSDLFTRDKQLAREIREDPDNFIKKNVFLVPEDARWDNIVKIARADDIKLKLDNILALLEKTFPKLKGLLPPIYAGSNLDKESVAGLINLFSKDIFRLETGGVDMLGRVYEYFIGEFANSEGKRGGEYFTPRSIVQTIVAMLEPTEGKVFDPCCGAAKILADQIRVREKMNLAKYRSFKEMLEQTLQKYHSRAIQAADVVRVMIEIRKDIDHEAARSQALNLSPEEIAFYDAVAANVGTLFD